MIMEKMRKKSSMVHRWQRKAIDGLQKLSGRWKHQAAKEQHTSEQSEYEEDSVDDNKKQPHKKNRNPQMEKKQAYAEEKAQYEHHSQSGTGITQDLSKEISAIYEAELQGTVESSFCCNGR